MWSRLDDLPDVEEKEIFLMRSDTLVFFAEIEHNMLFLLSCEGRQYEFEIGDLYRIHGEVIDRWAKIPA